MLRKWKRLTFEKLRKTFKRSRLSLTPGLHSGLGLGAYTQTSSPIRRYADLITQRQFTAMLKGVSLPHGREELLADPHDCRKHRAGDSCDRRPFDELLAARIPLTVQERSGTPCHGP